MPANLNCYGAQIMNKRTPLYDEHVKLGATIVPFGGWDMPVYYSTVIEEHLATRGQAGLFDTSHMGEVYVKGPDSLSFLQEIMTNDIAKIAPGGAVYSAMTNEHGGVIDDLWVYMLGTDDYLVVINAGTTPKDVEWIMAKASGRNLSVDNKSDETGMIALQGPAFRQILSRLTPDEPPARFSFSNTKIAGCDVLVSRTGYTGEDGVELYASSDDIVTLWRATLEAGAEYGIKPAGLGARDTLRLEACYSLYGHELSEDITPVEAGISFAVARNKSFIGSDIVLCQIADGPRRRVVAFELLERGVPRDGYKVYSCGEEAGVSTSGCYSPTFKKGIGLAMLDVKYATPGTDIEVEIRGKRYAAKVVKKPFIKNC